MSPPGQDMAQCSAQLPRVPFIISVPLQVSVRFCFEQSPSGALCRAALRPQSPFALTHRTGSLGACAPRGSQQRAGEEWGSRSPYLPESLRTSNGSRTPGCLPEIEPLLGFLPFSALLLPLSLGFSWEHFLNKSLQHKLPSPGPASGDPELRQPYL